MEVAAGLGALGFWIFLAAIVVAGIWFDSKKRESQQETLRRVVESGQHLDVAVIDKMVNANDSSERPDRDLKVAGIILFAIAPGMTILGWFLSQLNEKLFGVMLGVGALVFCVGIGLFVAGEVSRRWHQEDQA
jgi:hypothetical protein